jgi:hypothetical protein
VYKAEGEDSEGGNIFHGFLQRGKTLSMLRSRAGQPAFSSLQGVLSEFSMTFYIAYVARSENNRICSENNCYVTGKPQK